MLLMSIIRGNTSVLARAFPRAPRSSIPKRRVECADRSNYSLGRLAISCSIVAILSTLSACSLFNDEFLSYTLVAPGASKSWKFKIPRRYASAVFIPTPNRRRLADGTLESFQIRVPCADLIQMSSKFRLACSIATYQSLLLTVHGLTFEPEDAVERKIQSAMKIDHAMPSMSSVPGYSQIPDIDTVRRISRHYSLFSNTHFLSCMLACRYRFSSTRGYSYTASIPVEVVSNIQKHDEAIDHLPAHLEESLVAK